MASRKKHLAIRRGKRPWRNGERERTYFKQISLFRAAMYLCGARNQRRSALLGCCMYIPPRCSRRGLASSFWARGGGVEVSNLKGLKRFPRRVARRIVGPRTPIDRRLFLAPVALDPLSPLLELPSPVPAVTYCELLREPRRSPAERERPSLSTLEKFRGGVKNGADGHARPQYVSSRLV